MDRQNVVSKRSLQKLSNARNDKGFILAAVLGMVLLVSILAVTAIKLSQLGYMASGSERKFVLAAEAAE